MTNKAEIYVPQRDVDVVVRKWMLVPSERPNVGIHVVASLPEGDIPLAWILGDLAERGGRENASGYMNYSAERLEPGSPNI